MQYLDDQMYLRIPIRITLFILIFSFFKSSPYKKPAIFAAFFDRTFMKKIIFILLILRFGAISSQELTDTKIYNINDTLSYAYTKPKTFSYVKHSMQDMYLAPMVMFKKESIVPVLGVAASTLLLIAYDEEIVEAAQQFGRYINLSPENSAKDISPINGVPFYVPTTLSDGLYYIGDGITELAVNSSFYIYGLIAKDPRARQTASQLSEGLIATGVYVQILKHMTGRITARKNNNKDLWRWFPTLKEYHSSVPSYDAFPSGHLAIAMMTTTVISMNYPEKKYIKPIGYTLMALCGYQMLNNGVHWAGDYPLAIAMGYTIGKIAVNRGRTRVVNNSLPQIEETAHIIKPKYNLNPAYLGYGASGLRFTVNF